MSGTSPSYRRVFRYLATAAQSSHSVERMFWLLPHEPRRILFRAIGLDADVPQPLKSAIFERKALFIHVPKVAGISIQRSLFGDVLFEHRSFRQFELVFTASQLAGLFKFTFVRNPWDRLVSAWTFLREGGLNEKDKAWFAKNLSQYPDFESFVLDWVSRVDVARTYVHFKPQISFIENGRAKVEMDFVGRFENLAEDFERVACSLGCNVPLQSHNRTQCRTLRPYREYYTDKSAEVVSRVYATDIRLFGYEF